MDQSRVNRSKCNMRNKRKNQVNINMYIRIRHQEGKASLLHSRSTMGVHGKYTGLRGRTKGVQESMGIWDSSYFNSHIDKKGILRHISFLETILRCLLSS